MSSLTNLESCIIHDYLMETGFDKASTEMLKLLTSLDEEISASRWEFDRNSLSGIPSPDVQTRITRAAVDSKEVEVSVETSQDRILLGIFHEIRGSWSQKMWSVDHYN